MSGPSTRGVVPLYPFGVRAVTPYATPMVPGRVQTVVPMNPLGGRLVPDPFQTGAALNQAPSGTTTNPAAPAGCGGC